MWEEAWESPDEPAYESQRVLVAVVPSLADWEHVLREGWYRIPLRRAPRRIGAAYLGFYHPKCFGELRWAIHYYAAIRRYGVQPRRALLPQEPDHPRADELYFKLELGPLVRLPRPVPSSKLRRVTFIHTDLDTLLQAREIGDLWRREAPKERLWRGLQLGEATPPYAAAPA
jgi:hypothetical protein